MYRSFSFDADAPAHGAGAHIPWDNTGAAGPALLVEDTLDGESRGMEFSPLGAMQMAEASGAREELPITVTITLTTILWPGPAH